MNYTNQQLIDALVKEYEWLCHDDFNPEEDPTPEEYLDSIKDLSYDELVEETSIDDTFTLDEYMLTWGDVDPWNLRGRQPMQSVWKTMEPYPDEMFEEAERRERERQVLDNIERAIEIDKEIEDNL
jgi:hypothetical protein